MKFEDKLEELGYEQSRTYQWEYIKRYNGYISQRICFNKDDEYEIDNAYLEIEDTINTQQCIDSIQKAFDILQEDLKEITKLPEIKWDIWED